VLPASSCQTAVTLKFPSPLDTVFHSALHDPDEIGAPTGDPFTRN
jgi:hypothetical protein